MMQMIFLPLFFFLANRIEWFHLLHLLFRNLGEMTNEMDKFPTVPVVFRAAFSPPRHGGESNAVMDNVKQFSI